MKLHIASCRHVRFPLSLHIPISIPFFSKNILMFFALPMFTILALIAFALSNCFQSLWRKTTKRRIDEDEIPELPPEAKQLLNVVWDRHLPYDEVLASGFGMNITRGDLITLSGQEWLNDQVINFYLNLIAERNKREPSLPEVFAFNTFFYQKLSSAGYPGVKRWHKGTDIFAYDVLIVPVHLPYHWCLAVIDFNGKRIDYYDSMGGTNDQCLLLLKCFLFQESLEKGKVPFDLGAWKSDCKKDIPLQKNGSDCGVYCCQFAEFATRRVPPTFDQAHIPYFRQRMTYEIWRRRII